MIVRLSGTGQYELHDDAARRLDELDTALMLAVEAHDEERFHQLLHDSLQFVLTQGSPLGHESLVPSDVIIPPEDIDIHEARNFFTDEGLLAPLPA